jgi:hypothetical protein
VENLHYDELNNLHSPHIIRMTKLRMMRRAGQVSCIGEMRNAAEKSDGKRPLRRYR